MLESDSVNIINTDHFLMRRLPQLVELGVLLLLGWLMVSLWQGMPRQMEVSLENANTPSVSLPDLTMLTGVYLFGKVQAVQSVKKQTPVSKSPLHIQLLGLVQAGEQSAAIIKHEGQQHVYFVGEQIQPGVVLQAVESGAIIIKRHGTLEKVTMQKIQGAGLAGMKGVMPMARP